MRRTIFVAYAIFITTNIFSQSIQQIDSLNIARVNYILEHKACYLGGSLEELLYTLNLDVGFGIPDNMGPKSRGQVYYQSMILYLPWKSGVPLRSFKVTIANKVQVGVFEYHHTPYDEWDVKMRKLLGKEIVTAISK